MRLATSYSRKSQIALAPDVNLRPESPMRILIVEDETALALGLKFNFEQEGFVAVVAGDGRAALDAFRQAEPRFNLILLDLMLPGMSGYEICREIRQLDKQVPILVLSARTLSEDRTLGFD